MNNSRFIADVTIPDDSRIQPGESFVKTWRVQNSGDTTWGAGYHLVFLRGTAMTTTTKQPLPPVVPGQQVDVSLVLTAPATAGTHFGDWRLQDPQGNFFGQLVFLRIIVPPATRQEPPPTDSGVTNGRFHSHINVLPGTSFRAGATFTKTWRVENNGTRTWETGYKLVEQGGVSMSSNRELPLPPLFPGHQADLAVTLTAPTTPGNYTTRWQMRTTAGQTFGDPLLVEIVVVAAAIRPFDPPAWRETIWAITSIFESGRPAGNPAAYQTADSGIISYGKHQATLAAGSLNRVVQAYFRRSSSPTSQALQQEYAARIAQKDATLRQDARLRDLLVQAASEPAMSEAQDEVFEQNFYQPAITQAQNYRLQTTLGLACLYDTQVQGGLSILLPRVTAVLGGKIGDNGTAGSIDEVIWIRTFLQLREERLLKLADQAAARGDQINAKALRISTFRVTEYRKLLDAGNLYLEGELTVRGQRTRGL